MRANGYDHEAATTEIAGGRIDDGQGITDGHSGIDGIAAALQHIDTDLGRQMLRGHHHAVLGRDGCDRRSVTGSNRRHDERQDRSDHPSRAHR